MTFRVPERFRIRDGEYGTDENDGNNGLFKIPVRSGMVRESMARVIASDGGEWDHVSVSFPDRCPTWDEMCVVKALFWSDDECVMQLHPPRSDYVNCHPFCLHLWRPRGGDGTIPRPPMWMVGPKS